MTSQLTLVQRMTLEAAQDRSGDDNRHEAMKDLLLQGATEITSLSAERDAIKEQSIKDRKSANDAMSDALMWQYSIADGLHDGQALLVKVWRQRKEADREIARLTAERDDAMAMFHASDKMLRHPIAVQDAARVPEIAALIEAIANLMSVFPDPCRYDHHGKCQEHFIEDDCSVAKTKAALRAIAESRDGESDAKQKED